MNYRYGFLSVALLLSAHDAVCAAAATGPKSAAQILKEKEHADALTAVTAAPTSPAHLSATGRVRSTARQYPEHLKLVVPFTAGHELAAATALELSLRNAAGLTPLVNANLPVRLTTLESAQTQLAQELAFLKASVNILSHSQLPQSREPQKSQSSSPAQPNRHLVSTPPPAVTASPHAHGPAALAAAAAPASPAGSLRNISMIGSPAQALPAATASAQNSPAADANATPNNSLAGLTKSTRQQLTDDAVAGIEAVTQQASAPTATGAADGVKALQAKLLKAAHAAGAHGAHADTN